MLAVPVPMPLTSDLIPLATACEAGLQAATSGYKVTSNMYMLGDRVAPGDELKAWAWDLGWRESAWLAQEAKRLRMKGQTR